MRPPTKQAGTTGRRVVHSLAGQGVKPHWENKTLNLLEMSLGTGGLGVGTGARGITSLGDNKLAVSRVIPIRPFIEVVWGEPFTYATEVFNTPVGGRGTGPGQANGFNSSGLATPPTPDDSACLSKVVGGVSLLGCTSDKTREFLRGKRFLVTTDSSNTGLELKLDIWTGAPRGET